jgi:hypothetical protein
VREITELRKLCGGLVLLGWLKRMVKLERIYTVYVETRKMDT